MNVFKLDIKTEQERWVEGNNTRRDFNNTVWSQPM